MFSTGLRGVLKNEMRNFSSQRCLQQHQRFRTAPFYFFFLIIGKKYQIKRELFSHSLISIIGFVLNEILKSAKPFKIWSFFSYYLFHSYYRITFRFLRARPGIWEENCEHLFIRKSSYNFRIFLSLLNTQEDKGRPKID